MPVILQGPDGYNSTIKMTTKTTREKMKKGDIVKITGGNNEADQPTMIGKTGKIDSFGTEYLVKGVKTKEVYVEIPHFGLHCFNDYHLKI